MLKSTETEHQNDQVDGGNRKSPNASRRKGSDWRLSGWRWFFLFVNIAAGIGGAWFAFCELCVNTNLKDDCWTYGALGLVLASINTLPVILGKFLIHRRQLVDRSEVEATIVEARTVQPPIKEKGYEEEIYEKRDKDIKEEADRLENLGFREWTEYQVLSLTQMIVEFLEEDELKARADYLLDELKDYASEPGVSYDRYLYLEWQTRVREAKNKIEKEGTKPLKAVVEYLHQHVADYTSLWAEGSVIINAITLCGVLSVLVLLIAGLLPLIRGDGNLVWFNWGFLGILGAIAGVLVRLRESKPVEVGNTEGRGELLRAIQGAGVGLIAGVLLYFAIAGQIIEGRFFPDLHEVDVREGARLPWSDTALSVFWPIASGMFLRGVLDRFEGVVGRSLNRETENGTRVNGKVPESVTAQESRRSE